MLDAKTALAVADGLYHKLVQRRAQVAKNERYYRGEQPLTFATDEWRELHRDRYKGFSDNWCGVVGSAPSERMKVTGFRIGDDTEPLSRDEAILWDDWELNDGPTQSSQGILMSTIAKRSYALVWGNRDDEPMLSWEHPAQVILERDPETRQVRYGAKAWDDGDDEFLTLYTPDSVWKWQRPRTAGLKSGQQTESGITVVTHGAFGSGGWQPRQGADDDTWPLDNPMERVPIAEFANRPALGGEPLSDIEGTMAMQDAINLLWAYLFTAADYASMPARVVLGMQPPRIPVLDENGNETGKFSLVDGETLQKGRMLYLSGQNAKIDQWDAATLDVFTDVINIAVRHVAAQTRTPIYLVHGELGNVNGETLTGLDAPLVSKVKEARPYYAAGIRDVFSMFALVRGNDKLAKAARTGVVGWSKPEVQSDTLISDAAVKDRAVGIPLQTVLEERYGYGQKRVAQIMAQAREEAVDPYLAVLQSKDNAAA